MIQRAVTSLVTPGGPPHQHALQGQKDTTGYLFPAVPDAGSLTYPSASSDLGCLQYPGFN